MHSNIYQIKENKEKEDLLTEEELYDGFVGDITDYVSSNINRDEAVKELVNFLKPYGITYNAEENSIIFQKDFKRKYFQKRFEEFTAKANKITLEDFAGYIDDINLFSLTRLIEEKYNYYIYFSNDYTTLDEFIRNIVKEGQKYYLGSALDYHI